MAFIWRRRSTSIVKIIAVLMAIWFFVAFFIYTDDSRRESASNKWNAMSQHLKNLAGNAGNSANNQIDAYERGDGFGVGSNLGNPGGGGINEEEGVAADVPIAQPDNGFNHNGDDNDNDADINEGNESKLDNVVVHPNEKVYHGKLVAGKKVKESGSQKQAPPAEEGEYIKKYLFYL